MTPKGKSAKIMMQYSTKLYPWIYYGRIFKRRDNKFREDLKLYKATEIESSYIEIFGNNQRNVIDGRIYKYTTLTNQGSTKDFIGILLVKLTSEKN